MTLERPNPLITYSKGTLMMHDGDDNIDDHNAMMMMMMVLIMMIMTLWIAHLSRLGIVNLKQTNCFETALPHFVEEYGSGERYHRNWIWSQSGDPGNSNSNYLVLPGHYNLYYQLSFWFHKLRNGSKWLLLRIFLFLDLSFNIHVFGANLDLSTDDPGLSTSSRFTARSRQFSSPKETIRDS